MEERIENTMKAFRKHMFEIEYFETGAEAVSWVTEQLEAGSSAGFGGSTTVKELGLKEALSKKGVILFDPDTAENAKEATLQARDADAYFCSANALVEDGSILNVDGTGNRVSACAFGPKHLYLLVGVNKLVPDLDAAMERIKEAAVKNCQALKKKTPCAMTGKCSDCLSPDRSCRAYLLLRRPSRKVPTTVVLINESLGY